MGHPFYIYYNMTLKHIKNKMQQTEIDFSRSIGSTKLIAVSKVQPVERIKSVLDAGHRVFGENRVQEAAGKDGATSVGM